MTCIVVNLQNNSWCKPKVNLTILVKKARVSCGTIIVNLRSGRLQNMTFARFLKNIPKMKIRRDLFYDPDHKTQRIGLTTINLLPEIILLTSSLSLLFLLLLFSNSILTELFSESKNHFTANVQIGQST